MGLIKVDGKLMKIGNNFIKCLVNVKGAILGRAVIGNMILGRKEDIE